MSKLQFKNETLKLIDVMIENADKGPSGFWTEDYEGYGNPKIFPEFKEGLQHGKLIQKNHYLCPWNTAIMYGDGHGNIGTGCYHSCSIKDSKYLTAEMLKAVLLRFRKRLASGSLDKTEHISPLLTPDEISYIKEAKITEQKEAEKKRDIEYAKRKKKAAPLLEKYPNMEGYIVCNYEENIIAMTEGGDVNFNPQSLIDLVGGEKLSYNDYIDIQIQSFGKQRGWFKTCYYEMPAEFKGQIDRVTKNTVCFKRIFVTGMYSDGTFFDGKEDHVWMDRSGFEEYAVGDCVTFFAEVYQYLKTSNGKLIDFGLRNPADIKRIDKYELPTDKELRLQAVNEIICETCYLREHCSGFCLRPKKEIEALRRDMMKMVKPQADKDIQGGES